MSLARYLHLTRSETDIGQLQAKGLSISNELDCEKKHKGGSNVSALPLREDKTRHWIPQGVDEDLIDEYVEAMEKYGPGYPDSGWFKRAAKLEREMHDARLEARFDEN